jgi:anti-sigma regulatory factor (Ser/Thr protein kinase)
MSPFTSPQGYPAVPSVGAPDRTTWILPPTAESAQSARRQAAGRLQDWRLCHLTDDVTLIVSELVTNAICHGSGPIWHTVRRIRTAADDDVIRVEVGDYGSGWNGIPAPREAGDDTHCDGRGLYLVEAVSSNWGTWRLPHGYVVWAEFAAEPEPDASLVGS